MATSYEGLIGDALIHPERREKNLAKVAVKEAVCREMFCRRCGNILDQKTAGLYEVECNGVFDCQISVVCGKCIPKIDTGGVLLKLAAVSQAKGKTFTLTLSTWKHGKVTL
jgi:hypothetical protein